MIDVSVLPKSTATVFHKIASLEFIKPFYLSGGTALALQLKHRQSEDLDFFTHHDFDSAMLQSDVSKLGLLTNVMLDKKTLNCVVSGVKLQFLYYPYNLLEKPLLFENVSISTVFDVACTKLITISSRGYKKDFIDLYFLLHSYSLPQLFDGLKRKDQCH